MDYFKIDSNLPKRAGNSNIMGGVADRRRGESDFNHEKILQSPAITGYLRMTIQISH
jgi:hypothetical protein